MKKFMFSVGMMLLVMLLLCGAAVADASSHEGHNITPATCTDAAYCNDCSVSFGEVDPDAHDLGEWKSISDVIYSGHERECKRNCSYHETGDHTGGTPICTGGGICAICNVEYKDNYNHGSYGTTDWMWMTEDYHYRLCLGCGTNESVEDHTGGTATCKQKAVCTACGEEYGEVDPTNHIGGTATCTDKAVCTDCGEPYGELDPDNHDWGEWKSIDRDIYRGHVRECKRDRQHHEFGDHTGGTPICTGGGICTICSSEYEDGENHGSYGTTDWMWLTEKNHYRLCLGCGNNESFEPHTGGTATCKQKAVCTDCGEEYGEVDPTNHTGGTEVRNAVAAGEFSEGYTGDTYCKGCGDLLEKGSAIPPTHKHSYSAATCTTPPTCSCKATSGEALGHAPGAAATCTTDQVCTRDNCGVVLTEKLGHNPGAAATCTTDQVCSRNGCGVVLTEKLGHNPGAAATCTTDQVCTRNGCGEVLNEKLGHNPGAAATCTTDQVCTRDNCGVVLTEKLGHNPGTAATCTTDQVCTRDNCGVVLTEKLGHNPGAEATCTTDQVCTRNGCGVVLTEKLGHDYAATVVQPTCTKKGYTTYTCARCSDSYKADEVGARGHWYDLWRPCENSTHEADCKRSGCNFVSNRACALYEVTIGDNLLTVCPVCGDYNVTPFEAITTAKAKAITRYALPRGELIVRGMVQPFETDSEQPTVLYAFTAAYEFAGAVEPFKGTVEIVVPVDAELLDSFKLMRVDVTPATETAERVEVWTEIPFTFEGGKLTFETDVAGLFLLIPAE